MAVLLKRKDSACGNVILVVQPIAYHAYWIVNWESCRTSQAKYIYCISESHLCNHYYYGEAVNITYSECSVRYPTCIAEAPYCHLWSVWCNNIFPHTLTNGMIFEEKSLNIKFVFWFSL